MKDAFHLGDFSSDPERDVREEIGSHLDLEMDALMAGGMSEAQAPGRS